MTKRAAATVMWWVTCKRSTLALLFVAVFIAATAATAYAAAAPDIPTGRDCLNPPYPADPTAGVANTIDPGPATRVAGDPFTTGSAATMYDRYGYAGLRVGVFDTPNKMDICQPFTLDRDQQAGNLYLTLAAIATALSVRLTRVVISGDLGALWDPVQQTLLTTVGGRMFLAASGIAFMAACVYVLWRRARLGQFSATATWGAKAAAITAAAVACMYFTVGVGGAVDRGIALGFSSAGEVVSESTGRDAADIVGSTMVDKVLYPTWQTMMFGNDTAARDKYSTTLWKASVFTVEEQDTVNKNPAAAATLIDTRRDAYKAAMVAMQQEFPQTYRVAAGIETGSQLWHGLGGLIATLAPVWFLLLCLTLMMMGSVVARVAIGLFPVVAVVAVFPRLHKLATDVATMVAKAVWRAFVASLAFFGFLVAGVGNIMRTDAPMLVKVVAILFVSAAMFMILKRFNVTPNLPRVLRGRAGKGGPGGEGGKGHTTNRRDSGRPSTADTPTGPTPGPGTPGQAGDTGRPGVPVPVEARVRARGADGTQPVNLGPLRSARRGSTPTSSVLKVGASVAGKAHPATAAALTVASARERQKAISGSSRAERSTRPTPVPLTARRAVPRVAASPERRALPAAKTYATATRQQRTATPKTGSPTSGAVLQGVVVKNARGYHPPPVTRKPTNPALRVPKPVSK